MDENGLVIDNAYVGLVDAQKFLDREHLHNELLETVSWRKTEGYLGSEQSSNPIGPDEFVGVVKDCKFNADRGHVKVAVRIHHVLTVPVDLVFKAQITIVSCQCGALML